MKQGKQKWRDIRKKAICGVSSFVLAAAMLPCAALAAVGDDDLQAASLQETTTLTTMADGLNAGTIAGEAGATSEGGWYALPTQMISSFQHTATGSNGKQYTYSYLSSGIERVVGGFSQSMYYIMGINGVNFDRGLRNNEPYKHVANGRLTVDAVTAVDGIMGTAVNSQPDEFLWNSCYRMNANTDITKSPFQTVAGEEDLEVHINQGNVQAYETVNVKVGGVEYAMPVVIYHEANFISTSDTEWTKEGGKSIKEWVAIENQRESRPNDAVYDPYIATWDTNSGGVNFGVELMYKLAEQVDKVTEESRDANGNATVMSRYVNANGNEPDKYASATALAQKYEDFAKASQYYMLYQLANGKAERKVAAILCGYQPAKDGAEAAYACRIFDPTLLTEDMSNSANYGGRLANSIGNFSTDINAVLSPDDVAFEAASTDAPYVRWYPVSTIVENADAVFICDAPYGNGRAVYLAYNQDGDQASIYTVDNNSYDKTNENINPLIKAAEAKDAKAEIFYKYPEHLFGVWYAQGFENCWMAPIAAAFMYPDAFTSVENVMAYAAKNFWHIKTANVNQVVQATCYDISLPSGRALGTPDANYESTIDSMLEKGNAFYLGYTDTVESLNSGDLASHSQETLATRTTATVDKSTIALDLSAATITVQDQKYTGKAIEPDISVTLAGKKLNEGDYALSFSNNTNVGTATVTISSKGIYSGTKSAQFKIAKAPSTIKLTKASTPYTGKAIAFNGKVTKTGSTGKVTYQYFSDAKCTKAVKASNVKKAGTYYVKATVAEDKNYTASDASKAVEFVITKADISKAKFGKIKAQTYKGKAVKPAITVKSNGITLKKGTDYKVTYKNNNKKGTAKAIITGKGNFKGSKTLTFKIK